MSDDRAEEIKKNVLSPSQWVRILFMVFYAVACWVLLFVLPVIIACQVVIALISGKDNENLRDFGGSLSAYFHSAMDYLLYVNDEKPWPFSDTDDSDSDDDSDDDDDDGEVPEPAPTPDSGSATAGSGSETAAESADDVFADISFTDAESAEGSGGETKENTESKKEDAAAPQAVDYVLDENADESSSDSDKERP